MKTQKEKKSRKPMREKNQKSATNVTKDFGTLQISRHIFDGFMKEKEIKPVQLAAKLFFNLTTSKDILHLVCIFRYFYV